MWLAELWLGVWIIYFHVRQLAFGRELRFVCVCAENYGWLKDCCSKLIRPFLVNLQCLGTNICFSRPLSDSNSQLSGRKIDYCPTILNWDRQISPRLLDIEDSQRHNLLLADKMLILEMHMSWLTLLWLYITQIHGNLGASWRWVSEHGGWDLKKGKNAFILTEWESPRSRCSWML